MLPVTRQSRLAYRGFTQTILVSGRIHKLYMPVAFRGSHCGFKTDPKINKPSARVQNSAALRLSVIKVGKLDASSRNNCLLQNSRASAGAITSFLEFMKLPRSIHYRFKVFGGLYSRRLVLCHACSSGCLPVFPSLRLSSLQGTSFPTHPAISPPKCKAALPCILE